MSGSGAPTITVPAPPASSWSPWQRLYGEILRRRRMALHRRALSLGRPTISIGNLHFGGGGKTPLCAALCRELIGRDLRVALLSRGHGRHGSDPVLVSRGDGLVLAGPNEAGDEPVLLARDVRGLVVAVDASRPRAARLAQQTNPIDVFVLDDAFSRVDVARDADVLAFPAADPWAGGRLLPSGRLREPLAHARFAHAAVLTGSANEDQREGLRIGLARQGFRGPVFLCPIVATEQSLNPNPPNGPVLLVSGIARPSSFERTARDSGLDVREHLRFADHHSYPERSVRRIRERSAHLGARVVVTAKDFVKLEGRLAEEPYELRIQAQPEPAFYAWVVERLGSLKSSA